MAGTTLIEVGTLDQLNAAIAEVDAIGRGGALPVGDYTIRLTSDITLGTSDLLGQPLRDAGGNPITVNGTTVTGSQDLYALNPVDGVSLTVDGRAADGSIHEIDGAGTYRGFMAYGGLDTLQDLRLAAMQATGGSGNDGGGGGAGLGGGLFVASGARMTLSGVSFSHDGVAGGAGGYDGGQGFYGSGGGLGGNAGGAPGGGGGIGSSATGAYSSAPGPLSSGNGGILLGEVGGGSEDGDADGGAFGGGGAAFEGGGVGANGPNGGFGGGAALDGDGGFGGGGAVDNDGGFGGGGGGSFRRPTGAPGGTGGFGAGTGDVSGGGGGLGAGGDIFVQQGGNLTIAGGSLEAGTLTPGEGSDGADAGQAYGDGLFIQGYRTVTLAPSAGQFLTIAGTIADQTGSNSDGPTYGQGSLLLKGAGTVDLTAANTFQGGTTLQAGTLELAAVGAAGTGGVAFAGPGTTLQIDAAALTDRAYTSAITGFGTGDTIDLPDLADTAKIKAHFNAKNQTLTVKSAGTSIHLSDITLDPSLTSGSFELTTGRDASGTGTDISLKQIAAPVMSSRHDLDATVSVGGADQMVDLQAPDNAPDQSQGGTSFVYTPGGEIGAIDVIDAFKLGGADHDKLNLPSADFRNFAALLHDTGDVSGSATITDPKTGDAVQLKGVTTAELKAHPKDFFFG